jgi:hypothetical protein
MRKITSILTMIVTGMLVLSACSPQPAQDTPVTPTSLPPTQTAISPTPTAAALEPTAQGQLIITLDDQGKTINLAVGQSFLLKLGEEYTWEVTISDQTVLSRVKGILVVQGAQGVYAAQQVGTVTLTANGDPLCRQSQPQCEAPSIQFQITIVVA